MFVFPAPLQIEAGSGHNPTIPYASEVGGLRLGGWEKNTLRDGDGIIGDESALDSDCCNIITESSRCVNFQPQDPTKGRHFAYLEDPGTRFTRVLGFCVIFTFSWTVVRSSRLLIPIGCPSIVRFKRNSEFEKHRWYRCLLFAGAVGMSFCDAHDSLLFRVDPIQQMFNVQGVVFVKTKTCPVRVTRLAGSVLMLCNGDFTRLSLCYLPLYVASACRTAIRRWMASAGPSEFLPAPRSSFFCGPSTSPVSGAQRKVFASNLPGVRWRRWMDLSTCCPLAFCFCFLLMRL